MPELNQTTNVEILGEEYKIKSDISPERTFVLISSIFLFISSEKSLYSISNH